MSGPRRPRRRSQGADNIKHNVSCFLPAPWTRRTQFMVAASYADIRLNLRRSQHIISGHSTSTAPRQLETNRPSSPVPNAFDDRGIGASTLEPREPIAPCQQCDVRQWWAAGGWAKPCRRHPRESMPRTTRQRPPRTKTVPTVARRSHPHLSAAILTCTSKSATPRNRTASTMSTRFAGCVEALHGGTRKAPTDVGIQQHRREHRLPCHTGPMPLVTSPQTRTRRPPGARHMLR